MFGLRAFYRGAVVFAMLPNKRALESPKAITYKLPGGTQTLEGQKWRLFELQDERDIANALACLDQAYEGPSDKPRIVKATSASRGCNVPRLFRSMFRRDLPGSFSDSFGVG